MKKFKIPPCQNHSLSPMVGKWAPLPPRLMLRVFQPVSYSVSVFLQLEEVSSRPPLPKADHKMNNDENLVRGCIA